MLSMSSDNTLGSSASREWTFIDYGPSRSSTPDSSASSRLAAQLERSAYRRSRSNVRRRQNSNHSNVDGKKPSRSKRLKHHHNQRNQSHEEKINGSVFVVDNSQKSSSRRSHTSADTDKEFITRNNGIMSNARPPTVQTVDHFKDYRYESGDDTIVTAYPISSYDVEDKPSCSKSSSTYNKENFHQANTDIIHVSDRPGQSHTLHQNGVYHEKGLNGSPTNKHQSNIRKTKHFHQRSPNSGGVSKVWFEESWEDAPKTAAYTIRENVVNVRENISLSKPKHGTNLEKTKIKNTSHETANPNPRIQSPKHRQNEEKRTNTVVNCISVPSESEHSRITEKKDISVHPKVNRNVKEVPEPVKEEEIKPLKLRQLIKIHEVQIAEVARSAASMKKLQGKFQEGRLVKVTAVPEIENKQSHIKRHAEKISITRNKTSFEETDNTNTSIRDTSGKRPDVRSNVQSVDQGYRESVNITNDIDTKIKPKRHTIELRSDKSPLSEDQKWKRHTAIGLVRFDRLESREHSQFNGWSPTGKVYEPLGNDSDLDIEYMRKQKVEPEIQVLGDVGNTRFDDIKTSRMNGVSSEPVFPYKYGENQENKSETEQNEVPPERPPLPEHFYSSSEEMQRPPSPDLLDPVVTSRQLSSERVLNNEILKPLVVSQVPQCSVTWCRALPAVHVSTSAVVEIHKDDGGIKTGINTEERDTVLGSSRTTREMYEERLARIDLIPLDKPNGLHRDQEVISTPCSSLESFVLENDIDVDKATCVEKLKSSLKQVKQLAKEKSQLEKNFDLELRDWKRKYEEQHKVANAYQKLEDRYRRRVEELKTALMQCACPSLEGRKVLLLGRSGKRTEPYFFSSQTQSILDETEEWLKEQSIHSEVIHNAENLSTNTRGPGSGPASGNSFHGSLSDVTGGTDWAIDVTTDIDQYNGTSV